jgi:hypothetical protein
MKQCASTKSPIKKRDRPTYHVPRRVVWRLGGPSSKTETWIRTSGARLCNARLESLAGAHRRAFLTALGMSENGTFDPSPATARTSSARRTQQPRGEKYLEFREPGFATRYFVLASDHAAAYFQRICEGSVFGKGAGPI